MKLGDLSAISLILCVLLPLINNSVNSQNAAADTGGPKGIKQLELSRCQVLRPVTAIFKAPALIMEVGMPVNEDAQHQQETSGQNELVETGLGTASRSQPNSKQRRLIKKKKLGARKAIWEARTKSRADTWSAAIRDELRMREIISLIIKSAAMYEFDSDEPTVVLLQSPAVQQDIRIESVKAHETMFRESCKVTVADAPRNDNISGRTGSLLYFDEEREQFAVKIDAKRGDGGECRFISPGYLEMQSSKRQHTQDHSQVELVLDSHLGKALSFRLEREMCVLVNDSPEHRMPTINEVYSLVCASKETQHSQQVSRSRKSSRKSSKTRKSRRKSSSQASSTSCQQAEQTEGSMQTVSGDLDESPTVRVRTDSEDVKLGQAEQNGGGLAERLTPSPNDPEKIVFTLPFETSDERLPSAASGLDVLNCQMFGLAGRTSERDLLSSIGSLMVCERDMLSTQPGYAMTETVCDLCLKWIRSYRPGNDMVGESTIVYDIKFLSNLICRDQNRAHDSVGEDIFSKRMLLFPFHRQRQWSLVAVLNPGAIKTCKERDYTGGQPCMLFLDPLGPNTKHDKNIIASKLVMWLNKQWRDRPGAREDDVLPFSRHTMKGYKPKVPLQEDADSEDSALYVCRYVYNMLAMAGQTFTKEDSEDNFAKSVTGSTQFNFTPIEISQLRVEVYALLVNLKQLYSYRIDPVAPPFDQTFDGVCAMDCDCNNPEEVPAPAGISLPQLGLEDERMLTGGDSSMAEPRDEDAPGTQLPASLDFDVFNNIIEVGDEIEYKLALPIGGATLVKRAAVTAFSSRSGGSLDMVLNTGDSLVGSLHLVRRMTMKCTSSSERVHNPQPQWRRLDQMTFLPDETDLGTFDIATGQCEDLCNATCQGCQCCNSPDVDRTAPGGLTRNKKKWAQEKLKKQNEFLDSPRRPGLFASWKTPDEKSKNQKSRAINTLNKLYGQFMSYGDPQAFYDCNLHTAKSYSVFKAALNNAKAKLSQRKKAKKTVLDIKFPLEFEPQSEDQDATNRGQLRKEKITEFEHKMSRIDAQCCPRCKENKMIDVDKEGINNGKEYICSTCRSNKKSEDHYLENNMNPVWYERDGGGNIKIVDGKKVVRYDIPPQLTNLTIAERLLIRRCAPFIPSVHIKNGVYGIKGHCVAFPQDITEMCNQLPQRKETIVTFIRQMGNKTNSAPMIRHLKVRKLHVIEALKWLKVHHSGYHNIEIKEDHLDWMEGEDEANLGSFCKEVSIKPPKNSTKEQKEYVSKLQCQGDPDGDDLDFTTMQAQEPPKQARGEQQCRPLNELAKELKPQEQDKMMYFPPHSNEPINEFASTNQVFVNAYPWLFPGGIGDLYDPVRGQISNVTEWGRHLIRYFDGRFLKDQTFCLYLYNVMQRHQNNKQGGFFFHSPNFLGKNPPTLRELKQQIKKGNYHFINMLRYFSKCIPGSDSFWRGKTNELRAWIDYHVSRNHGPPTHFITLSCAENWWPDLRRIMHSLETNAGNVQHAQRLLDKNDFAAMCQSVKRYPLYVNEFFMKRGKEFMDNYVRDVMGIEYYWGRVEFAPGRGQIHLHILAIANNKAYLHDFYRARDDEAKQIEILNDYATNVLDMTANTKIDETRQRLQPTSSPLSHRYVECTDEKEDEQNLTQDCLFHECNDYCLDLDHAKSTIRLRRCRMGYGQEETEGKGDTPGKDLRSEPTIVKDRRGVEHLTMKREHSKRIVQHSRSCLMCWRANVDCQLIIYRSDPNCPDIAEIEGVCRYVVAYAGKRYKTQKQEKEAIQNIILDTSDSDIGAEVRSITKKSLNALSGHRMVPIQEAVHQIAGFPLTISSDYITNFSISSALKLKTGSESASSSNNASAKYNKDLANSYRNRLKKNSTLVNMSLERYFYEEFRRNPYFKDSESGREKIRILLPTGLNCKPKFPISYEYARGMLIMHKPWSVDHPLEPILKDKNLTVATFQDMIKSNKVPYNVKSEFYRAMKHSQEHEKEAIAKEGTASEEPPDLSKMTEDERELYIESEQCHYMTEQKGIHGMGFDCQVGALDVDIGLHHDWSKPFFDEERDVTINGEDYVDHIREQYYEAEGNANSALHVPKKKDGSDFKLEDLSEEQRVIVLGAVDAIFKFLNNDEDYVPFRATILGCGGTGKSFIINTMISIVLKMTHCNDSVRVAAPSGGAAFNVQGCTIHRSFSVDVSDKKMAQGLSAERQEELSEKLKRLLLLVIDERSQVSSKVLAATERNIRECIFGQQNSEEQWGGLPAILLFGDDYQLLPVIDDGAVQGYSKYNNVIQAVDLPDRSDNLDKLQQLFSTCDGFKSISMSKKRTSIGAVIKFKTAGNASAAYKLLNKTLLHGSTTLKLRYHEDQPQDDYRETDVQCLVDRGSRMFIEDMTQNVFLLNRNYRVKDEECKAILSRLRTGDSTDEDADRLMGLHLFYHDGDDEWKQMIENHPKTMWLYARNEEKDNKNIERLVKLSREKKVPVARLECQWISNRVQYKGPSRVNKRHFSSLNIPPSTDLCVHAKVAIGGVNLLPEVGLYNGARGELVDFNYGTRMAGPNNKHEDHLPAYTVVDIPHLKLPSYIEPWDKLHPTHVPIPTRKVDCTYNKGDPCCSVRYVPLVLAWATTLHKFQGYEAGFEENDAINRLIINPGNHSTELKNPGMFYVAASRGKTFGKPTAEQQYPKDSAIYWAGPVSKHSIKSVKLKQNGDVSALVQKRDAWVEHLYDCAQVTAARCNEEWQKQVTSRARTVMEGEPLGQHDLDLKIIGMLRRPNKTWESKRRADHLVPTGYFS